MHNTDVTTQIARKTHRCTWCAEEISVGQSYSRWITFDGSAATNKMHPECLDAAESDSDDYTGEYMPYCNERPRA